MTKPHCKILGTDEDVFVLAARVKRALHDAGQEKEVQEFMREFRNCHSYDKALQLMMKYVEVE